MLTRRGFLKSAAMATAGVMLPGVKQAPAALGDPVEQISDLPTPDEQMAIASLEPSKPLLIVRTYADDGSGEYQECEVRQSGGIAVGYWTRCEVCDRNGVPLWALIICPDWPAMAFQEFVIQDDNDAVYHCQLSVHNGALLADIIEVGTWRRI